MTTSYAKHFQTRTTPQSEAIPGKPMVANLAGGFCFAIDDWARLQRFLVLGSDGGVYYATEKKLTIDNAQCVVRCLDADPARTVATIASISHDGRAPKNDPAIFALAIAAGHANPVARRLAEDAIPRVCRIPTHLFSFVEAVKGFRGWGRGLRRAIGAWYTSKTAEELAFAVVKYQQRNGWSNRDLLRLTHPEVESSDFVKAATLRWIVGGMDALASERSVKRGETATAYPAMAIGQIPRIISAFEEAKAADRKTLIKLILFDGLPRECVPTESLNDPEVWSALLVKMKPEAMIRNLGKMTAVGLLKPLSVAAKTVADRLGNQEQIHRSRIHPIAILLAAKTYGQGHGDKGKLSWNPVSQVNDALDAAFYLAFKNVEPTGKRTLIALDVSGSMDGSLIAGTSLTAREASATIAMVTAKTEPQHHIVGFTGSGQSGTAGGRWGGNCNLAPIDISSCSRLSDVIAKVSALTMGGTDCSLPMRWATENKIDVDSFAIWTDNETWFGSMHPCQALRQYRERHGIMAKLAVCATEATEFSIADPADGGSMDFVGFDSSTPSVMADFFRG